MKRLLQSIAPEGLERMGSPVIILGLEHLAYSTPF
jgi:hypothetical protein